MIMLARMKRKKRPCLRARVFGSTPLPTWRQTGLAYKRNVRVLFPSQLHRQMPDRLAVCQISIDNNVKRRIWIANTD